MNLMKKGKLNKEVYLPDDTKLHATYLTELPFKQLSDKASEADILPGIKTPLISVNKLAKEGYTTIFHPGEDGVTIHEPGMVTIATTAEPILQGCKTKGEKLWTVSVDEPIPMEQAHHASDLSSVGQTIRYLHGVAGFPTEDTWIKAIKAGHYKSHQRQSDTTSQNPMKHKRDT
jgi:hypothetical protein